MKFNNVVISAVSSYLPKKIITNSDIKTMGVDTTDEWVYDKLGIKQRCIVGENELPSDMALKAVEKLFKNTNIDKEEIDLIIVSTSSPEQIAPPTACILHNKLKLKNNIPAFDLNAVCSGFVYALTVGASFISSGNYKNILIVSTEAYSKHTDWSDRHSVFFGDGAGAALLSKSDNDNMFAELAADGSGTGMTGFIMPLDGVFKMRGKEVWNQAIKVLPKSIKKVLNNSSTDLADIKMLIPHQPSINILKLIAEEVGLPMSKVKTVMDKYANIASSSIPIALEDAIKNKEVISGDQLILTGIGSGWSWGSLIVKYKN